MNSRQAAKRSKYLAALAATAVIFVLGILLGIVLDQEKVAYVEGIAKNQEVEFNSLQVQYLYLNSINETGSCPVIEKTLENNLKTFQPILERLMDYEAKKTYDADYENLKRNYLLANIRYNLLAERSKAQCGTDLVRVLYFYSEGCSVCGDQGYLLSNMKSDLEEKLLVFPIDTSFSKEPMVSVLMTQYNVTEFPALVIEEKKYTGFQGKEALLSGICPLYRVKTGVCIGVE